MTSSLEFVFPCWQRVSRFALSIGRCPAYVRPFQIPLDIVVILVNTLTLLLHGSPSTVKKNLVLMAWGARIFNHDRVPPCFVGLFDFVGDHLFDLDCMNFGQIKPATFKNKCCAILFFIDNILLVCDILVQKDSTSKITSWKRDSS